MKWLVSIIFAVLLLVVTVFGLGPALMADGPIQERIITLVVVLVIYVVLIVLFRSLMKRLKKRLRE
jgi:formate hydrogenlyase subunit 4